MKKHAGRPKFNPTRSQRDMVMTCVAAGLTQQQIADALGICLRVVCDRFRRELDTGRAVRICENLTLLRRAALKHNVSAMRCLAGLYANPEDYGLAKLGKKARARRAAESAAVGTPWEHLLNFPARHDDQADTDGVNGQ
jgi:hypothetical protein